MEDTTEDTTSFWNKSLDDLTVGETMKATALQVAIIPIALMAPVIIYGTVVSIRERRKAKKQTEVPAEVLVPDEIIQP